MKDKLTPEQVAHIWAGFDLVRFHEVVARPAGKVGYAVVQVQWEFNDSTYEPGTEGGTPFLVYRRREDAETAVLQLNKEDTPQPEEDEENDYQREPRHEANRWLDEPNWPFIGPFDDWRATIQLADAYSAVRYEIVEIELPDLRQEDRSDG